MKKILTASLVLAFLFAPAASASPSLFVKHRTMNARPGCPKTFTVKMVKRAVYWTYRGVRDVSRHDARVVRRIVRCERFPRSGSYVRGVRKRVIKRWRERRYEDALTPYGNWAIPGPIVGCESTYQNLPPNSAGASGYYQIVPGTWAGYGGLAYGPQAYEAPKIDQDIIAGRIWRGGGPSQWVCAGLVAW